MAKKQKFLLLDAQRTWNHLAQVLKRFLFPMQGTPQITIEVLCSHTAHQASGMLIEIRTAPAASLK